MLHRSHLERLREDMTREGLWNSKQEDAWQDTVSIADERSHLEAPPDAQWIATLEVRASGLVEIGELQEGRRLAEEASTLRRKSADLAARKKAILEAEEKSRVKAALLTRSVITGAIRPRGERIGRICRECLGQSARVMMALLPEEVVTLYTEGLRIGSLLQLNGIILQVPEEQRDRGLELGVIWYVSKEYRDAVKARAGVGIRREAVAV